MKRCVHPRGRHGLAMRDVVVTVLVGIVGLSLVLPAVRQTKGRNRRTQCLNNLHNLSLGIHTYATARRGRLPGYGAWDEAGTQPRYSWVVELLPFLDQSQIYDRWDKSADWDSTVFSGSGEMRASNQELGKAMISVLSCPQHDAQLSYVANAGFSRSAAETAHHFTTLNIDWDGDGRLTDEDHTIGRDSGLMWQTRGRESGSHTLDEIYDGSASTILLAESTGVAMRPWANPGADNCAFTFPVDPASPSIGQARPRKGFSGRLNDPAGSWLSSSHPGGINYANAEGGASFMSEGIAPDVLRRLITPRGTLHDEAPLESDY